MLTGLFHSPEAKAQDSSRIRISLLTCSPGNELYSTFGHSAIRMVDSLHYQDLVFNFGTFNFDDEGFYLKFIQGKLLYFLSTENFDAFCYNYQATGRSITEQVLNLTGDEKIKMRQELLDNAKEENKYYLYDFFFDNCTTRLRDLIEKHTHQKAAKNDSASSYSFRYAIHQYLDKNNKDWSKLGIDLLLGAHTDRIMTITESQFLPDKLMIALDELPAAKQLVAAKKERTPFQSTQFENSGISPLLLFSLVLLIYLLAFQFNKKINSLILSGMDGILFFSTGMIGIILVLMWTATNHAMCRNNFNLLWALPLNAIMAFFIRPTTSWMRTYFGLQTILLLGTLVGWFFIPQKMNSAFLPIALLLLYRSAGIYYHYQPTIPDEKKISAA